MININTTMIEIYRKGIFVKCTNNIRANDLILIPRSIHDKIDHKICLKIDNECYWVKSEYGIKSMEKQSKLFKTVLLTKFKLVLINDKIYNIYCHSDEKGNHRWLTKKCQMIFYPCWKEFNKHFSVFAFLELWIWYKKIIKIEEFLHNDIIFYIKTLLLKSIKLIAISRYKLI